MANITLNQKKHALTLSACFDIDKSLNSLVLKTPFATTLIADEFKIYLYLGKQEKWLIKPAGCAFKRARTELYFELKEKLSNILKNCKYDLNIDLNSFKNNLLTNSELVNLFVDITNNLNYRFTYKTNQKPATTKQYNYNLLVSADTDLTTSFNKELLLNQAINNARQLQETPPNILNSTKLAQTIKEQLSVHQNLKVNILGRSELEKLGAGLLLGVNAASKHEPQMVIVEYHYSDDAETIGLVGKGITFDSGGYNIKPTGYMFGMKFDMSGAAIMAQTMAVIAQLKPHKNVVAALAITDNMVGPSGITPEAVLTSMSGKTVEVTNTDAEGRLVMADAMTYLLRHQSADLLINAATLTGAVSVAIGSQLTGVLSSCNCLYKKFEAVTTDTFEEVWRLPFHRWFSKEMRSSKIADLKNSSSKRQGGASCAASFLKEFIEDKKLIHLDIAGTATNGRFGTGVMIKTISEFIIKR